MQCRLLKKFSLTFASISLACAVSASASSVTPQVPYVSTLINGVQTVYIASVQSLGTTTGAIKLVDTTVGFKQFDFTVSAAVTPTIVDPNGLNVVKFVVNSAQPYMSISATAAGNTQVQIPIVWSQSALCVPSSTTNNTVGDGTCSNSKLGASNGYQAAILTTANTNYEVGINLNEICTNFTNVNGCDQTTLGKVATTIDTATNRNSIPPFALTFQFYATNVFPPPSGGDAIAQTVQVEITPPVFNCPLNNDLIYFPGDGQISLDPSQFTIPAQTLAGSTPNTLMFVAADGAAPDETSNFPANAVIARIPLGGGPFNVGGFNDTTTGSDHVYKVGFGVGDLAGALSSFTPCGVTGVQTSPIQTFLKKSSCFIATAAFRSGEDAPVLMLRRFRDQVLLEHTAGKLFVRWYYSWSPSAAEWLMENPAFRFPVLLALIPVQILGWLALHTSILLTLLLTSLGLSVFLLVREYEANFRRRL